MKLERQRTVLKFREPVALSHISPPGRNFQVGALGNAPTVLPVEGRRCFAFATWSRVYICELLANFSLNGIVANCARPLVISLPKPSIHSPYNACMHFANTLFYYIAFFLHLIQSSTSSLSELFRNHKNKFRFADVRVCPTYSVVNTSDEQLSL